MAKQKLTLLDRVILPNVLKNEGTYMQMVINVDIRKKCQLTQEEFKEFEITQRGEQIRWNEKGSKASFTIEFTDLEQNEIRNSLKELDEKGKLTEDMVPIYKIFVA